MANKGKGVKMAKNAISLYEEQAGELRQEQQAVESSEKKTIDEYRSTLEQLAKSMLTSNDAQDVHTVAKEVGAPRLLERQKELLAEREQAKEAVVRIDADERYVNRDQLIHPTEGEYPQKINAAKQAVAQVEGPINEFEEDESFRWLFEREYHARENDGAFSRFWRAVTLVSHKEKKAEAKVVEKFGGENFAESVQKYKALQEQRAGHQQELEKYTGLHNEVVEITEQRAQLLNFDKDFDNISRQKLQKSLAEHLSKVDLNWVHNRVRPAAKVPLAKLQALLSKLRYFGHIKVFVDNELGDREKRISSISAVAAKWAQKPGDPLTGNKNKWLHDVPQGKHKSTKKKLKWLKSMRGNIDDYDDYEHFSYYMDDDDLDFLPYDAFAYDSEERMPYEGFAKEVIPDLGEYRSSHDQEKADYSGLKTSIKDSPNYTDDWAAGPADSGGSSGGGGSADAGASGGGMGTGAAVAGAVVAGAAVAGAAAVAASEAAEEGAFAADIS